jgi:hypothetical protein
LAKPSLSLVLSIADSLTLAKAHPKMNPTMAESKSLVGEVVSHYRIIDPRYADLMRRLGLPE